MVKSIAIHVTLHAGYYIHSREGIVLSFDDNYRPDKTWRGVYNTRYCFAPWRLRKVAGVMNFETGEVYPSKNVIAHVRDDVKDLPFIVVRDDGVVEVKL
jgi:hypothetical protein